MSKQTKLDKLIRELDVSRIEVIGSQGRAYQCWNIKLDQIQIQDDGRTLKIFIYDVKKD